MRSASSCLLLLSNTRLRSIPSGKIASIGTNSVELLASSVWKRMDTFFFAPIYVTIQHSSPLTSSPSLHNHQHLMICVVTLTSLVFMNSIVIINDLLIFFSMRFSIKRRVILTVLVFLCVEAW